jgi:hypothetical protein
MNPLRKLIRFELDVWAWGRLKDFVQFEEIRKINNSGISLTLSDLRLQVEDEAYSYNCLFNR